ncbi:putative quinol monooxygenase [Sphingobium subterraneum]|uniref:Quinol monooxygenase YgiN n=1 Tax=Sphingobium subterraneum TaxID=627688 RepID=A0A841J639_9SPHN|nr:antibiotic biosynthesis monooxygenase [Sphingobium subterraneum]MBB6124005.1 quinol monooxygenase YgiN [Sphingobium subterraneum]
MPVIVAGTLTFAGDSETCASIIRAGVAHIADSRREEGCVAYNWAVDPLDPATIHVFEEWDDEKALLRHFQHSSYRAMRSHLERYDLIGFHVQLYSAGRVEPVYDEAGQPRSALFDVSLP